MDEVLSPTLTIKVVGFFLGGLTLYILNKMRDTKLNGQKNNMYYNTIINKNKFNMNLRSSNLLAIPVMAPLSLTVPLPLPLPLPGGYGYGYGYGWGSCHRSYIKKNNLSYRSAKNQRCHFYISNIRAINRVGPHDKEVLSVIIGSLLGDASPFYKQKTFSTLVKASLNPN